MSGSGTESFSGEFFGIFHHPYCDNGVGSKMGPDDKRLILEVTYDSNAAVTVHPGEITVEFASELGIADIMNHSDKPVFIKGRHTSAPGTKMAVVIGSIEKIADAVLL